MQSLLATIQFPDIDPVMLRLGPLNVRWYGVAYLLGFAFAYLGLRRLSKRGGLLVPTGSVSDLMSWAAFGVIVGGRAGWWLFYHRGSSNNAWYEAFAVWHGGMSFHGGLIGASAALFVWSRHNTVDFLNLADCVALVAPIGLFFGRLANFINAELVGRMTNVPWAVVFPGDDVGRHPSQLYEAALEGPLLLVCLWRLRRRTSSSDGQVAASFLILYGMVRVFVEMFREPDADLGFVAFGWLTMGQLLSIAIAAIGVVMLSCTRGVRQGRPSDMAVAPEVDQK